jgi:HAMP domain-containing protein
MKVSTPDIRTIVLAVMAALAALLLVATGTTTAHAAPTARVGSAVAAGTKADGIAAICVRQAKRKALRAEPRAKASRTTTKQVHRAKAALRRRCIKRLRRANGATQPSAETPNAGPLAVGIDGGYASWGGEEVEFRTQLGASVTRHEWDPSEPVDAQDNLVLQAATEIHTRIHALLGGNELGDASHYRDFVVAFIQRYGQGGTFWSEHPELDASRYAITTFELGNEPYFGGMSASEYADTVRPTLEAVKQLGLPAKLIVPSYIYGTDTHWIDTLYQRIPNLNELFYAFADHPYWYGHDPAETGDGNSPFERIETLRAKMAEHGAGDKPLFITEYGESTANCGEECVSESTQAEHIQQMIEAAASHKEWGVELLCLYQLHDWATDSGSREEQFGLLQEDGTPKAAYSAAEAAMRQYRG